MSTTIRQQIISAVFTHLAGITKTGGFETDLGKSVHLVRRKLGAGDPDSVVLWPKPETSVRDKYGMVQNTMPIEIEALAAYGNENPSTVSERMLGDLIKRMGAFTSFLIESIDYTGGGTPDYPEGSEEDVGTKAGFNIVYYTVRGDPYTQ